MKKYIFFMTNQKVWFNVAKQLYQNKIAEPVIWLGDDTHFKDAKKIFGDSVYKDLIHRHRNYKITDANYNGEYEDFFYSENYLRAKDISFKMMDRIDLYGSLGRLDREVYFHNLLTLYLKKIYDTKPDLFISAENPHDYPKYIIYEICQYLKIPCFKFYNWMLSPMIFLQNIKSGEIITKKDRIPSNLNKRFTSDIKRFVDNVLNENKYELYYMKTQRINEKIIPSLIRFIKHDIINYLKDIKHNFEMLLKGVYNPINPYRLNFFSRIYIQNKRRSNLLKASKNSSDDENILSEYVYFPLHYEPEKTTNPDGGVFHDQFLALVKLRKFVPDNIKIIIKEHPSQLYRKMNGARGRSPLFYNLIKNINGVKIVNPNQNSINLIKNSLLTVTITGTVAIEASLLGKKALAFGNPWYNGCPNIFIWNNQLSFNEILNSDQKDSSSINEFFINLKDQYSIPGFINGSQRKHHANYSNNEFDRVQDESVYSLLKTLFINHI